ncbi:BTB/POZ domain-containing protein 6-A-like [Ornithodoros turicata]|uniref:BTB/POZ domain-containing protein 6-A-like n=1 Tax=Ornithodoros turicata TaxID=34597 RepID=UPI00313A0F0C
MSKNNLRTNASVEQGALPSLSRRALNLLEKRTYVDVEFIVGPEEGESGETKFFEAHKLILAMNSEAFEAMFYGDLAEQGRVRVVDLDAVGFEYFLRYLYSERLEVTTILEALQTRLAAEKYLVSHLVTMCTDYIGKELSPKNVCKAKEDLALFHENRFDDKIEEIIKEKTKDVLESEAFIEASEDTVHTILRMNTLTVSEDDLMCALYAWARAKCSKTMSSATGEDVRTALEPFLKQVRFLAMTTERFVEGPVTWRIFSSDEALSILANLVVPKSMKLPAFCTQNASPRV